MSCGLSLFFTYFLHFYPETQMEGRVCACGMRIECGDKLSLRAGQKETRERQNFVPAHRDSNWERVWQHFEKVSSEYTILC